MGEGSRLRAATEFLGFLALIASLGFVGTEIRQNTIAVRSATTQSVADQTMNLVLAMATDEHLPRLLARLADGVTQAELSPEDNQRLQLAMIAGLRRQENLYLQVEAGVLDRVSLANTSFSFYRNPFGRQLWSVVRPTFDQGFAGYWEEVLQEP